MFISKRVCAIGGIVRAGHVIAERLASVAVPVSDADRVDASEGWAACTTPGYILGSLMKISRSSGQGLVRRAVFAPAAQRASALAALTALAACSGAGGSDNDDQRVGLPQFPASSNPGAMTPGSGTAGSGSNPAAVGAAGSAGTAVNPPANNGSGGSEGNANVGGLAGSSNQVANTTPGGAAGAGGTGNDTNPPANPPPPGVFTSVDVDGGASARFVCPTGVTFGNPLTGMGAVQQITAPQGGNFAFIEGALWIGSVGKVFFSDNASQPAERIWQVTPPSTTASVFMENSGSNGLAVDINDQLLLADQRNKRITRVSTATAQVTATLVPAGNYTPNDLIMRSDGNIYFTDPNTAGRGFYRVSPAGALSGPFSGSNVPNSPNNPNGIELSPDENTLYVGDVNARFVAKLALNADGSIDTTSGQRFVSTMGDTDDGMAVDCAGNLYVGTRTGVEVYTAAGALIGMVPVGETSNATFGGADRRTLFVTSRSVLKFVTLGVPGLPD
jgi:gluconolactonase